MKKNLLIFMDRILVLNLIVLMISSGIYLFSSIIYKQNIVNVLSFLVLCWAMVYWVFYLTKIKNKKEEEIIKDVFTEK